MRFLCYFLLLLPFQFAHGALHPLFKLENVYPSNDVELKVAAMAFSGENLYITLCSPDRTNVKPFKDGEIVKVTGLIGNSDRSKIKSEVVFNKLYEPTAIAIHNGSIYVGEKDKISRLEDLNGDGQYQQNEKIVLIDGISQPNFHTYTIGFELLQQDGDTYLVGNLTTSILLGGKRDLNITVNPKTKRGSTFIFGPITGKETAKDVDIQYLAGGYRTPNGIGLGDNNAVFVTDNEGVFNPANEFIRITPGAFYGHYLHKRPNTNIAAYQPEDVDSNIGGSEHQTPATVYMPQGLVSRSPGQPIMLRNLPGEAAAYNGQFLLPDINQGRLLRIFTEEVEGTWQGVVFHHSSGMDKEGVTGFTAGPNRIVQGPDKHYYIGHIGAGGLWGVRGAPWWGLQRMSLKKELPEDFNEIVAVRDHKKGLVIEFLRKMPKSVLKPENFEAKQWTYIPTNGYGGAKKGEEALTISKVKRMRGGKKALLVMDGIRSNSPPFIKGKAPYSNKNVGWVIQVDYKPESPKLWQNSFWYTMLKHKGESSTKAVETNEQLSPTELALKTYKTTCASCHSLDGSKILGPSLKGIFNRKQTVIRNGKEIEVVVDEDYLKRALNQPRYEHPKGFLPAMPDMNLNKKERAAVIEWIKTL